MRDPTTPLNNVQYVGLKSDRSFFILTFLYFLLTNVIANDIMNTQTELVHDKIS